MLFCRTVASGLTIGSCCGDWIVWKVYCLGTPILLFENVRVWEFDLLLACFDLDLTFWGACLGTLVDAISLDCRGCAVLAVMFIRRWAHLSFDFFLKAWLLLTDFDRFRSCSLFFSVFCAVLYSGFGASLVLLWSSFDLPLERRGLCCFLPTDSTVGVYLTLYWIGVSSKFSSGIVLISVVETRSWSRSLGLHTSEKIWI